MVVGGESDRSTETVGGESDWSTATVESSSLTTSTWGGPSANPTDWESVAEEEEEDEEEEDRPVGERG